MKKSLFAILLSSGLALAAPGCSSEDSSTGETMDEGGGGTGTTGADAATGSSLDSGSGEARTLPTWQLEDMEPESSRFGQTYGLSAFDSDRLIVLILDGF